jgi:myo-inositol-1(or 4)-monophosphatase
MHPLQTIAVRAARSAGEFIVRHIDRLDSLTVSDKGRNDLVSEVDRGAEQRIIDIISKAYPGHAILAEESGATPGDDCEWIIDPLDGTMNFLHGLPHFAVSIAVRQKGVVEQGVIFDPIRQEMFSASKGGGAQVEGRRMRVNVRRELRTSLLSNGLPFREISRLDQHMAALTTLTPKCAGLRRTGSAALDLAYVAAGRLDGFWEWGLQPWDSAAGTLMVREAGGIVTDEKGTQDFLTSGNVVAAAPKVHAALLPILRRTLPVSKT